MDTAFLSLPARDPDSGLLNVVVDTPKGSRNKYKYDEKTQVWRLSKVLPLGASFPFDFGFIPSTKGGDGDPLGFQAVDELFGAIAVQELALRDLTAIPKSACSIFGWR